jgi:hypothetical protein
MNKIIYIILINLTLGFYTFAQEEAITNTTPEKNTKFVFRAGAANSLNYFKPQNDYEVGYKKISLGNGLGTELSYKINKKIAVNLNYYFYYYKNKIDYEGSFLLHDFKLNQQNHFIAATASFTIFSKKTNSIFFSTGPGFTIKNEQILTLDSDKMPLNIREQKRFKYAQPISISIENFVKNKIILGASVQTFLLGEKRPFNGVYLFSYLGLPF